jgi:heme/copper-type cytochrome/quinol oxidase subunit 3
MSMIVLGVAIIFAVILAGLSVRANARFQQHERLPMQWSLAGTVNWTAPRALALALIPALGTGLLGFIALLALNVRPRAGQEGMVLPVTMLVGAAFLGAQLVHFWLIERTLDRDDG